MKTSILTTKYMGEPLVGAEIFTGVDTAVQITDANGEISTELPDDYATTLPVAVRHSSLPFTFFALFVLEAGLNYEINIPVAEVDQNEEYTPLLGLHSRIVTTV